MAKFERIPADLDRIAAKVVDASFKVHTSLGPGLLESVYQTCLTHELQLRGMNIRTQVPVPIVYEGLSLDSSFRIDILAEEQLIVELKAVETILPVHEAQILTYLKLAQRRLGLLINFNVPLIKDGIRRFAL